MVQKLSPYKSAASLYVFAEEIVCKVATNVLEELSGVKVLFHFLLRSFLLPMEGCLADWLYHSQRIGREF